MKIRVEAASTQPIGAALATWGSVLCKTTAPTSEQQPTPQLCCVAGRSDDGADVLAVLEQLPAPSPGQFIDARTTFKKPSKLSFAAAAQLPLLLLTAASALELAGVTGGGTAVVAGSAGALPALLVQLLAARGTRAVVAARAGDADRMRALGAAVVDHNADAFATAAEGSIDAVIDTLGDEEAPDVIEAALGCTYVSAAPPRLRELASGGLVGALLAGNRGGDDECVWAADDAAAAALRDVLELADAGALTLPGEGWGTGPAAALELAEQYGEFLNWARDADTGLRCGFPGKDLWEPPPVDTARVVGPVVGTVSTGWGVDSLRRRLERALALDADDGAAAARAAAAAAFGGIDDDGDESLLAGRRLPVPVRSEAEVETLKQQGLLLLQVHAPYCSACPPLLRLGRQLAASERYAEIAFATLDAAEHKPVAEALGVASVPAFVLYRGGADGEVFRATPRQLRERLAECLAPQ